ncbi:MAG: hypothetical protein PW999_09920 [Paraburkholderia tropica]|nr:hypothetical protein [Paraburkholderia tropica]
MSIDLDQLEALAKAAGGQPWAEDGYIIFEDIPGGGEVVGRVDVASALCGEVADFMAAANPAAILELIAEVRRLSGIVEKYIDPKEVRLTGMHPIGGALHIGLEGGACKIFAESFAEQFRESCATNYVEMTLESNDAEIGELLVTLQRVQGKTPAQLRREAEAERDALRDDAERLRAELNDFTTQCGELNEEVVRLRAELATPLLTGADAPMYGGIFCAEGISHNTAESAFYAGASLVTVYYGRKHVYPHLAAFMADFPKEIA